MALNFCLYCFLGFLEHGGILFSAIIDSTDISKCVCVCLLQIAVWQKYPSLFLQLITFHSPQEVVFCFLFALAQTLVIKLTVQKYAWQLK